MHAAATAPVVLADVQRTIGFVLAGLLLLAFAVAVLVNMRKGRAEVGSEIELAPNRKPYMNDDELETTKLDRTLGLGLVTLVVIAVALPLYWLAEPGRQDDAIQGFENVFVSRGEELYVEGVNCAACHGPEGVGGVASYTITDPSTGDFIEQVDWKAPALDTLLYRYTPEQVKFILNYGRGNTPMPAWGAPGGGPLTDQQLDDIVFYLQSIQLPAEEWAQMVLEELELVCAPDDAGLCTKADPGAPGADRADAPITWRTAGEALFNLGYYDGFAGGAAACARCHTPGWSYGDAGQPGLSRLGPNLTNGSTLVQFPAVGQHEAFVSAYPKSGTAYGTGGISSGKMGAFGTNPNTVANPVQPAIPVMDASQVMLTPEQIALVVAYERSL
ncbi:MAG TPA: cytochrome c [Acidimicrobiales bacterium]